MPGRSASSILTTVAYSKSHQIRVNGVAFPSSWRSSARTASSASRFSSCRVASVSAAGPTTKLVRMDRGAFQRLLGPLDSLLADGNALTSLPAEVATIPTLTVLFVQENQITALPDSFLQNSSLKRVNLAKNPIVGCESHIKHLKATCTDAFWEP